MKFKKGKVERKGMSTKRAGDRVKEKESQGDRKAGCVWGYE